MRSAMALALLALLAAGCAAPAYPAAAAAPPALPPAPLGILVEPAVPVEWASANITGDVAVAVTVLDGGPCHAIFRDKTNSVGTAALAATGPHHWVGNVGGVPFVQAGGIDDRSIPANGEGGVQATLSAGDTVMFWGNDLRAETALDAAPTFHLTVTCDVDSHLRMDGARQAILSGVEGFNSTVAASEVGADVALDGTAKVHFEVPADIFDFCSVAIMCDLQVTDTNGTRPVKDEFSTVAPGDATLHLRIVGSGTNFFVAAAAWRPIDSLADLEALPS